MGVDIVPLHKSKKLRQRKKKVGKMAFQSANDEKRNSVNQTVDLE
jgi:hypothetical protein